MSVLHESWSHPIMYKNLYFSIQFSHCFSVQDTLNGITHSKEIFQSESSTITFLGLAYFNPSLEVLI